MKKRILGLAFTSAMLAGLMSMIFAASPFQDVSSSHWAYSYIQQAYDEGVMTGTYYNMATGIREFSPDNNLTLAELLTVLTRAFYGDEVEAATATGVWYAKNVVVAKAHGLLAGIDENSMTATATRYQMALLMTSVMEDKGAQMPPDTDLTTTQATIPDWSNVPSQYQTAVSTVYGLKIIQGIDAEGTFNGEGYVTRAAAAVIYTRLRDSIASLASDSNPDSELDTTSDNSLLAMLPG